MEEEEKESKRQEDNQGVNQAIEKADKE